MTHPVPRPAEAPRLPHRDNVDPTTTRPSPSPDRPVQRQDAPRVWRDRAFTHYLASFGLSLLGDQIWFVALAWAAARLNSPAQAALVMTIGSVPRSVLILIAGTFADRWGPLRMTLTSQTLRTALMAAIAVVALAVSPSVGVLAAVAFIFSMLDAAHMPAAAALPPHLLPRENLPAGQGMVQTLERVATIVGAPAGGFLVAVGGLSLATAANATLFCLTLLILRTLRLRTPHRHTASPAATAAEHRQGTWRSLLTGLTYAARHPVIGPLLLVVTVLNMAVTAPLNIGIALLANTRGWHAGGFSAIIAAFGAGAAIGALSVLKFHPRHRPATAGLIWVAAGSTCIAALGAAPNLPTAIAAAALLGFTSGPASALLPGLVQAHTNTAYLGRIMALVTFSAIGLVPVAFALFGLLIETTTLTTAFLLCALADLLTALTALSLQRIRTANLDQAPGQEDHEPA